MSDELLYNVEDHVARITINREKQRNTISPTVIKLFHEYLDAAEKDVNVRALLITGAGDKCFSAGAQLAGSVPEEGMDVFAKYAELLKRLASFPKPTVARVKGYCLAGGMGFMLACDIVIAGEDSQFGTPEVNVGLWPMMIGALIFRNVSMKKAMEMILLGEKISAKDALTMGLVTRIVPVNQLDSTVNSILKSLILKSPIGIKIGKAAFHKAASMSLDDALEFLSGKLMEVAATDDAREGITAFIEKREPKFTGK